LTDTDKQNSTGKYTKLNTTPRANTNYYKQNYPSSITSCEVRRGQMEFEGPDIWTTHKV